MGPHGYRPLICLELWFSNWLRMIVGCGPPQRRTSPCTRVVFICSSVSRCCKASLSSSSDDIQANINHGSVCRYGATATCVCPVASGVKVGPHAIVIDTVPTLGCVLHGLWPWWPKGKLNVYSHMVGPRASSTITQ